MKIRKTVPQIADKGTPETIREKLTRGPSTMESLISSGKLLPSYIQAAEEISRVYCYQVSALFSKNMRYGERGDKGHSDNDPKWFIDGFVKRYKPWADNGGPWVAVCISVLIDGHSGRELDRWFGWRKGTAISLLVEGLEAYAIVAGWVQRHHSRTGLKYGGQ